jgi:hypothetical protein
VSTHRSFLWRIEDELARLWNQHGRGDGLCFVLVHPGEGAIHIDDETVATIKNVRTHFGDVVVVENRYVASGDMYLARRVEGAPLSTTTPSSEDSSSSDSPPTAP